MKVLFVTAEKSKNFEVPPFVKAQGDSLKDFDIEVSYFSILEKGISGYLTATKRFRSYLKKNDFDIIHAHFTFCAFIVLLSLPKQKIVLSLMGSDAYGEYIGDGSIKVKSLINTFLTLLVQPFVSVIISKSPNIERFVWMKKKSIIIPNGVNLEKFKFINIDYTKKPIDKFAKKVILFLSDPSNPRKNFKLVKDAYELLDDKSTQLITPYPVKHKDVVHYLNLADVLVFSSFMEGSPNLIKEAMACNCPIVSTNVGDIEWLLGDLEGHFISDFNPQNFSNKIKLALEFSEKKVRTNGSKRLLKLKLGSSSVAKEIASVYKKINKNS